MKFARRVFFWSGVYGVLVLVPMYFLEERMGRDFPPPTNHPEHYYAFLGVALAWQFVFLLIARDPLRYRPLMLAGVVEKFLPSGSVVALFALGRVAPAAVAPFLIDVALGILFLVSYFHVGGASREEATSASPA